MATMCLLCYAECDVVAHCPPWAVIALAGIKTILAATKDSVVEKLHTLLLSTIHPLRFLVSDVKFAPIVCA